MVYTYIVSPNHSLVIKMGEPSNVSTAAINPRVGRRQYLVTYFQAGESNFSTQENFGEMLEAELNAGTSVVKVNLWTSREEHQNDSFRYHCVLKLTSCKK